MSPKNRAERARPHRLPDLVVAGTVEQVGVLVLRDRRFRVAHLLRHLHRVELQVQRFDAVTQRVEVTNVHLSAEGVRLNAYVNQYTTPREFDLMARIAGLRLRERWESWTREPFTAHSRRHVSVYELPV